MSTPKDGRRLTEMQSDIDQIRATFAAHGRDAFLSDRDVQDATLWRLYRLADSACQLSEELRNRHTEIEWDRVRGFRNFAAHGYRALAIPLISQILDRDVPTMRTMIEDELERSRNEERDRGRDDDDDDDRSR